MTALPPPPPPILYGTQIRVGPSVSTVLADCDFETYSQAGFHWCGPTDKKPLGHWVGPPGAAQGKKGLGVIGVRAYAEHWSTEVLTFKYDLKDGHGKRTWKPGQLGAEVVNRHSDFPDCNVTSGIYIGRGTKWGNPYGDKPGPGVLYVVADRAAAVAGYRKHILGRPDLLAQVRELIGKQLVCSCAPRQCHGEVLAELAGLPWPLFDHFAQGKLIEAHNAGFEQTIWEQVCVPKYGWPSVNPDQWRCSAAKSRAFGLPSALADVGEALNLPTKKDAEGKRLLKLFSWPKDPTKKDPRWRVLPSEEPADAAKLDSYCETDIETESQASARCPDLPPNELAYWLADQRINRRGIGVDMGAVRDCMAVVNEVLAAYDDEMFKLIGLRTSQAKALVEWLASNGVRGSDGRPVKSLAAEELEFLYEQRDQYPHPVGRVLEIRGLTASASVKKVFAMANHASRDARLCDLFIYHGARTGRDTHADVQPGNLPKAGPNLRWCEDMGCRRPYGHHMDECPWCGASSAFSSESSPVEGDKGWCFEGVDHVLEILQMRSMHALEHFFGDALLCVSGVVRSLLVAREGHRLICSDYSSIEAVVSAVLTGEEWRVEAFRRREDIYLHGAAGVTGRTYEWYMANGGKKHPDRQKIGKPAELGLGFGGFSGALFAFGFEGEKKEADRTWMAWRAASPAFEEMWGGQYRGVPWDIERREYFGLEGCAVQAVLSPGQMFFYRGVTYQVIDDVLYCTLLSGRRMAYHQPRLWYGAKRDGWVECYSLTYMTWNTNAKMGPRGWVRMETYGGRLFENCIAEGTLVLTERGWVPIESVLVTDRVHDGVEFVNQKGSLYKGVQGCMPIDGVLMTPDHRVLTDDGWKEASQFPRPYRPQIRNADRSRTFAQRWKEVAMVLRVRVWAGLRKTRPGGHQDAQQGTAGELRMQDQGTDLQGYYSARDERAPSVRGMALDAGSMPVTLTSSLGELRRAWDSCVRAMATELSELLGRHGAGVPARLRNRSTRQQRELFSRELPLGNLHDAGQQSAQECPDQHPGRSSDRRPGVEALQDRKNHLALPDSQQLAGGQTFDSCGLPQSRVYDLLNCGPRQRFVVLGASGPFIVHNCVQATARDIMAHAVVKLEAAGYPVVLRVHDEVAAEVPNGFGSLEEFERILTDLPDWAKGWPIRAAGWEGIRYHKD